MSSIKKQGVISVARAELGLSQSEFGAWLAERMGRADPFPASRVSEWEHGRRSPRRNVRQVCIPVSSKAVATDTVMAIARVFGERLEHDGRRVSLPPDLRCIRDDVAEWISTSMS